MDFKQPLEIFLLAIYLFFQFSLIDLEEDDSHPN